MLVDGAASRGGAAPLMQLRLIWEERSEAVDDATGEGLGVESAAGSDGYAEALELGVDLAGKVDGKGVVAAAAQGVDVGHGVE